MEGFFSKVGRQLRVVSFSIVDCRSELFSAEFKASYFGDEDMDLVTRSCPNLVRLDLPICNKITSAGWRLLAIRCMQLEMLSVGEIECA